MLTSKEILREVLSGISVSLTLIPTSIAYALFMGMSPMVGMYASIVMSLTTAILGSQPGLISNATAAVAVPMIQLVQKHGGAYLFVGVIVGGFIQMMFAFFNLNKYFKYVPAPVISGFLIGLAGLIARGQVSYFKDDVHFNKDAKGAEPFESPVASEAETEAEETTQKDTCVPKASAQVEPVPSLKDILLSQLGIKDAVWLPKNKLWTTIGFTLLGVAIMFGTYLSKIKIPGSVPGAIVNVIVITTIYYVVNRYDKKLALGLIGDKGAVGGKMLSFKLPAVKWNLATLWTVLPYSISMAVSTLTESMMMVNKSEGLLGRKGDTKRENFVMGLGNVLSGFTGGMGGNVCVGLSQLNIANGARTRLSGIIAGIGILIIMLFFSKPVQSIPMAALIAIMVFIVYETGDWKSLKNAKSWMERFVILLTAAVAFSTKNLAAGVGTGTVVHYCAKGLMCT